MEAPVIKDALSDATNRMVCAISSGVPTRFMGTPETKASLFAAVPVKRVGTPEKIAQAILFVASDKASFITGASIAVDGGKLAR